MGTAMATGRRNLIVKTPLEILKLKASNRRLFLFESYFLMLCDGLPMNALFFCELEFGELL